MKHLDNWQSNHVTYDKRSLLAAVSARQTMKINYVELKYKTINQPVLQKKKVFFIC